MVVGGGGGVVVAAAIIIIIISFQKSLDVVSCLIETEYTMILVFVRHRSA